MLIKDCQPLDRQDATSFFTLQYSRHPIIGSEKGERFELAVRIIKFTDQNSADVEKASKWGIERQLELSLGSDVIE